MVIATPDAEHVAPAVAFAEAGYHVLLEKPMAPTERECRRIAEAAAKSGVVFAVGHVLRYTPYTIAFKKAVAELGDIVSVQHLEPVGYWHQAHSFVRGNWRREADSSFMLMAKSCHDIDWLCHVVGRPIRRVSSFGALSHFTPANRPPGATDRCLDCPVERSCAYSAKRFYFERLEQGRLGWPLDVVVDDFDEPSLTRALREGPYGRCVYSCDNDVVDHQVVAMEFEGGATGTFTMTGFNAGGDRQTRVFGTRGSLEGDGRELRRYDFLSGETTVIDTRPTGDATAAGGHGGGDDGLMEAFVTAVTTGDRSGVLSDAQESLHTHLAVFAAERARREAAVVGLNL